MFAGNIMIVWTRLFILASGARSGIEAAQMACDYVSTWCGWLNCNIHGRKKCSVDVLIPNVHIDISSVPCESTSAWKIYSCLVSSRMPRVMRLMGRESSRVTRVVPGMG